MDDLKNLTVKYLRDLARKHLGKGHSKLKTKEELLDALKEFLPASLRIAGAAKVASMVDRAVQSHLAAAEEEEESEEADAEENATPAEPTAEEEQHAAEPLIEGFFVARVAGAEEARRHRMTEQANRHAVETRSHAIYDEKLGELPSAYDDDTAIALPRDPNTVFFWWDFNEHTRAQAFAGLNNPKAILRIYDGDTLVREVDFALESKSFYVQGLTAGRRYRIEAHAVGTDGESRRVGRPSNLVALPSEGPSSDTSVRFLRAPWNLPVGRLMEHIRGGEAQVSEGIGARHYLDVEEWEELANSARNAGRRVTERWEGEEKGPGPAPRRRLDRTGASEQHMVPKGWPSGRK